MAEIHVLNSETIDKIAAGEVIERPSSVVKELVENAVDAGASAVTVEIRGGGTDLIRVTDNGSGIAADQVPLAFFRHATSKIKNAEDLFHISSLGFRGEALSSIAAVSRTEVITKTRENWIGTRYVIEGGEEKLREEVGAPDGTTFLVHQLFYNTPVRKKFLKSPITEASYILTLMERMALSRPDVSMRLIVNGQTKLHTSGSNKLKDIIYSIYGRDAAANLQALEFESQGIRLSGFVGKPVLSRGNRGTENYFVNGRFVKSQVITRAIEDAYHGLTMQHKYPFTAFHIQIEPEELDVNVHPTKMELKFGREQEVFILVSRAIRNALFSGDMVRTVSVDPRPEKEKSILEKMAEAGVKSRRAPEPFEIKRKQQILRESSTYRTETEKNKPHSDPAELSGTGTAVLNKPDTTRAAGAEASAERKEPGRPIQKDILRTEKTGIEVPGSAITTNMDDTPETEPAARAVVSSDVKAEEQQISSEISDKGKEASPEALSAEAQRPSEPAADAADPTADRADAEAKKEQDTPEPAADTASDTLGTGAGTADADVKASEAVNDGAPVVNGTQMDLFEEKILVPENTEEFRLIGQLFDTYWLMQYKDQFLLADQHAAHEKVLFEKTMASLKSKTYTSQQLQPPLILTLNGMEEEVLRQYGAVFRSIGFEIEAFGGTEYAVYAVPDNLFGIANEVLLIEMLDDLAQNPGKRAEAYLEEKVALMSCKAAVKGNQRLSFPEAETLLKELLQLDNPYTCPHGRPTVIRMSRYEIEKKFKRIV